MPRNAKLDRDLIWAQMRQSLLRGPTSAAVLARTSRISQSSVSRVIAERGELVRIGRRRNARYALRRHAVDVTQPLPIYAIGEDGTARQLALLHLIYPQACYFEALDTDVPAAVFGDLPYFLHDLRPSGFLGRLVPEQHPELRLPPDVRHWSAEQTLGYLSKYGWDVPGNIIVGDGALTLYNRRSPATHAVELGKRRRRYPTFADDVLGATPPGSSAGGEQPKFLVTLLPERTAALVKFSPVTDNVVGRRYADLLVAEHVAHETLRHAGHAAARSEVLEAGGRLFLEVLRFDRTAHGGRRGLLSLEALDAEFVGKGTTWSEIARALWEQGHLDKGALYEIEWREQFGRWIGNTDMHPGNLSLFTERLRPVGLAPVYDMVPMHYVPRQGNVLTQPLSFTRPLPPLVEAWLDAGRVALEFWNALARHPRGSDVFRSVARENAVAVAKTLESATR